MVNPSSNADLSGFQNLTGLNTRRVGQIANDLITRGCAGTILAVVTDAVYLQTDDGEIFWLAHANVPMHARGVQCSLDARALRAGMRFSARDAILQIGENLTVDLRAAPVWRPCGITNVAPREIVQARASIIARNLVCNEAISHSHVGDCFVGDPSLRSGRLLAMTRLRELIGLGAGLTPAGDDFVGGVLFAAHHLRQAYALTWDTQPIDDLLNWARTQTNIISYTMLHDHARGIGVEPLHDLMVALLARDASDNVAKYAARLACLGSSTGVEILAGTVTALRLIEGI